MKCHLLAVPLQRQHPCKHSVHKATVGMCDSLRHLRGSCGICMRITCKFVPPCLDLFLSMTVISVARKALYMSDMPQTSVSLVQSNKQNMKNVSVLSSDL